MIDYKELFEKTFDDIYCLKFELTEYYFPECEIIFESEYEKGLQKYNWWSYIVLKYFGELYKVSITSRGNGGWLSIDDCNITDIKKTKRIDKVINSFEFV